MRRFLVAPFIGLIRLYQKTLPALYFWPTCRYEPSCSEYMIQALRTRGLMIGLMLGTWRVLRCNPWFGGHGYDPVPERGRRNSGT